MKPRKTREIKNALVKKGFRESNKDHKYYILYVAGKKTSIRTKLSHGLREYGNKILSQVRKQLHLGPDQFDQFVECPLTGEIYVGLLQNGGHISR